MGRQGGGQLSLLLLVSTLSPDSGVTSFRDSSAKRPSPNPGSSVPWCELSGAWFPKRSRSGAGLPPLPHQLQTLVQVSARATLHLGGGVAQAPRFKHQGGGGLGAWGAVPGKHPSQGAEPPAVQVPSLWRAKRFSAPPPSQSSGLANRRGDWRGRWGGVQEGYGRISAGQVLSPRVRGGGVGRLAPVCARAPALCAWAPRPTPAALRGPRARAPVPLPARGGQGVWCGRHE